MNKLYKYRNFNDTHVENIIKNSSLFFSPVKYFNDPFDCKLSYRQKYTKHEILQCFINLKKRNPYQSHKLKDILLRYGKNENFIKMQNSITEKMIASVGVLSLSSNYNNILMWSHYSRSHTGLVFEFTPNDMNDEQSCFFHPLKVDYAKKYEELSYVNDGKNEIPKLLLTKYKDWAYEEEYRCFGLDFQGEKKFHKNELTSIIFGAKTLQKDINRIIKLCKDHNFLHLNFKQAVLQHGSFSLSFKVINN